MKKIKIILGSTRDGRNGTKVVKWFIDRINKLSDTELSFELVDLKDWPIPFIESSMPPIMGTYPAGIITDWSKVIEEADGFVLVSPEYNHGYTAVLKNVLDVIYKEWNNKPVTFVGYGAASGGIRAVEQLKQVVLELKMVPLHDSVFIQNVWAAFDENNAPIDQSLDLKADALVVELKTFFSK